MCEVWMCVVAVSGGGVHECVCWCVLVWWCATVCMSVVDVCCWCVLMCCEVCVLPWCVIICDHNYCIWEYQTCFLNSNLWKEMKKKKNEKKKNEKKINKKWEKERREARECKKEGNEKREVIIHTILYTYRHYIHNILLHTHNYTSHTQHNTSYKHNTHNTTHNTHNTQKYLNKKGKVPAAYSAVHLCWVLIPPKINTTVLAGVIKFG